jgi:hypothetical protein
MPGNGRVAGDYFGIEDKRLPVFPQAAG